MLPRHKIFVIILAATALLLSVGLAAVKLMLSDARLAELAHARVKASLGRELTLDELSLQFRPLPTVVLRNAALSNAAWAKERYLLHADYAKARLDLIALLRGRLELASLSIDGLTANLEVSADQDKNWRMPAQSRGPRGSNTPIAPLHLASLHVRNARIRFAKPGTPTREWLLEEASAGAERGWRNVNLDAKLRQNGALLQARASFQDLSQLGRDDATATADVALAVGDARLAVSGLLPISGSLRKHKLKVDFTASSARDMLRFFGIADVELAPIALHAELREAENSVLASGLVFQLGRLNMSGNVSIDIGGETPRYRATLVSEHLDWAQVLHDLGRPPLPPKPPGQLFRDTPLGWKAIAGLQKISGKTDVRIRRVTLRSGIELKDLKASILADEKQVRIDHFSFGMLDGLAKGSLSLDGNAKTARLNLDAARISLGKWLAAHGNKLALTGGPTDLKASLSASGSSMKDLAASLNGPIRISVGQAKLHSRQLQQAETWLIGLAPVFSETEADYVNLACVSAYLPFENGRAAAEPLAGIRSDASQLLASGYVNLRDDVLDLRGRVRARSGVSLGVANIAGGNLKIAGKIVKPEIGLDPEGTPGALARLGAAIITSGVSILATAIWDAANPASDPCQITFLAHEKRHARTARNASAPDPTAQAD